MAPIAIRGNTVDPANPGDVILPPNASDTQYVLVQLKQEMDSATLAALESRKAEIVKRMVDNTWLLHYPPSDLRVLEENIPAVQHALVYVDHFVVHSNLKQTAANGALPDGSSEERLPVTVCLHENACTDAANVLAEIQSLTDCEVLTNWNGTFSMRLPRGDLNRVAQLDSVQAIEETTPKMPHNDHIAIVSGIKDVNDRLHNAGKTTLTGKGQTVGLADTGVDKTHDAFKKANKVAKVFYYEGMEGGPNNTEYFTKAQTDLNGHGTHTAGTILGDAVQTWEKKDLTGVAPGAQLVVQGGIFRAEVAAPDLFQQAYSASDLNCRIHNNSWGPTRPNPQDPVQQPYKAVDAEAVDVWALEHQDFLIVYSAGNAGSVKTPSGGQVGAWVVAKNVLTVGASYTDRPMNSAETVDYSISPFTFKRGVTSYSSRGPVIDKKRTKPDVVAPGNGILSARASSPEAIKMQVEWPNWFGKPPNGFSADDKTIFCSGTSMAAPAVSGYAALLRQALHEWQGIDAPSAPLMKALLINGAEDLGLPQEVQGYGEINMRKVLAPVFQPFADIASGKAASGHGQGEANKGATTVTSFKTTVPQHSSSGKKTNLQVTLVYHDYHGDEIQNRMNLYVQSSRGKTETAPTHQFDNVHRLLLKDMTPGEEVTINVEPKLIFKETAPWGVAWEHYEI